MNAPEQEQQKQLLKVLLYTIKHFFGSITKLFTKVTDPRLPAKTDYPLDCAVFVAILMFLFRLGSRRQINYKLRDSAPSVEKVMELFDVANVPHSDTLNYLFKRLNIRQVQQVLSHMSYQLIRKKVFQDYRLFGYYTIAGDGTGMLSFSSRHCPHCLVYHHKHGTCYYHHVLDAKLVSTTGFAFSMMTEFIENPAPDCSVQDCELKAFYRLAVELKKHFPRLPICLLLDGLYASGPTFTLCKNYGWKFVITLKDKDLPSVNREFDALLELQPENTITVTKDGCTQVFHWVNDIAYQDTLGREHSLSVLQCLETKPGKNGALETTKFKWVTNFSLDCTNVAIIANKGGRLRWKIENEGFNIQKNGGFALEHAYSEDINAGKVFYLLMQMAHLLFQLIEKGSILKAALTKDVGGAQNLAFLLLEAWRNLRLVAMTLSDLISGRLQIRFDSS